MLPQLVEELEPIPEVADHYMRTKILLSRGEQMAKGHVVAQSHDANENVLGRTHANVNLDTRMNQVEFAGGKVT